MGQSAVKRLWRQMRDNGVRPRLAPLANITPVKIAIVSDLHLGTRAGADVARWPEARARLADALLDADHVVFLGDLMELRELPLQAALAEARVVLGDLAPALAGKRVTLVPGNHDHRLAEPLLERLRVEGGELGLDCSAAAEESPVAAELARQLPDSHCSLAYPGLWLRPDVYALHGHYLDLHMTVPRVESILSQAMARRTLGKDFGFRSPDDYEHAIGPLYALSYNLAQRPGKGLHSSTLSRDIWARIHGDGRATLSGFLLARVAIPAGVLALNAAGIGSFAADLSGEGLRLSGLRAMGDVVDVLGIRAEHVLFGHTHRPGPLPGEEDDPGWRLPGGARLWNTGSWFLESALLGERRRESPYWPGGVTYLHDSGPPEPVNVLRDLEF